MIQVFKIGGHVLDDGAMLEKFCEDFASLPGPKVLVHGGGEKAGRLQKALGIDPVRIEGRRVTDAATLEAVTMACAGWCNKQIVSLLQKHGCDAIGLSGCDANIICAARRKPKTLSDGVTVVDFGLVGDVLPEAVDVVKLKSLIDLGLTPVICPINHDGAGQLLNTNADTVASCVAAALGSELTFCFEIGGVLGDVGNPDSVIPSLDKAGYEALKSSGAISGGMIPKLDNAFAALAYGVPVVRIKGADRLGEQSGTLVC